MDTGEATSQRDTGTIPTAHDSSDERLSNGIRRRENNTEGNDFMTPKNTNTPLKADCPSATCSLISDLLPPIEIVAAAEKVRVWMEVNGHRDWQIGGVCDRRIANQRDAALAVIEAIEERFTDGSDTYEDWLFMGKAAKDFLLANSPADAR